MPSRVNEPGVIKLSVPVRMEEVPVKTRVSPFAGTVLPASLQLPAEFQSPVAGVADQVSVAANAPGGAITHKNISKLAASNARGAAEAGEVCVAFFIGLVLMFRNVKTARVNDHG